MLFTARGPLNDRPEADLADGIRRSDWLRFDLSVVEALLSIGSWAVRNDWTLVSDTTGKALGRAICMRLTRLATVLLELRAGGSGGCRLDSAESACVTVILG
jgi:hypothetical protein